MTWKIEDDEAWIAEGPGTYRHYSGTRLSQRGMSWRATCLDSTVLPARRSATAALELYRGFWDLANMGRHYGTVIHPTSAVMGERIYFAFISPDGSPFTPLVVSSLKRCFYGHACCVRCKEPMAEFRVSPIRQFDGVVSDSRSYLVCSCGFPVWHMEWRAYMDAEGSLNQCARAWQRKQDMKAAGGKHTRQEIDTILQLQEHRCIYCNALFTAEHRPTRDHLVPLSYGGTAWALNLVLACHSCNSRRGEVPFRTFCRLLSPTQNDRILKHLLRRIQAIDLKNPGGGWEEFEIALRLHIPNDGRYKMILSMRPRYRENARKNKLLPRGVEGVLNEVLRRQRAEIRQLRHANRELKSP